MFRLFVHIVRRASRDRFSGIGSQSIDRIVWAMARLRLECWTLENGEMEGAEVVGEYDAVFTRVSRKNGCPRLKTKQRQGMQRCRTPCTNAADESSVQLCIAPHCRACVRYGNVVLIIVAHLNNVADDPFCRTILQSQSDMLLFRN